MELSTVYRQVHQDGFRKYAEIAIGVNAFNQKRAYRLRVFVEGILVWEAWEAYGLDHQPLLDVIWPAIALSLKCEVENDKHAWEHVCLAGEGGSILEDFKGEV